MKISEITSEFFFNWLEEQGFKEGWELGYKLENEKYNDDISYEDFFKRMPKHLWLYHGPSITCAFNPKKEYKNDPDPYIVDFYDRVVDWREKYNSDFGRCDNKWMKLVWQCEDWEEYSEFLDKNKGNFNGELNGV